VAVLVAVLGRKQALILVVRQLVVRVILAAARGRQAVVALVLAVAVSAQ
jgi:hypothetical protein